MKHILRKAINDETLTPELKEQMMGKTVPIEVTGKLKPKDVKDLSAILMSESGHIMRSMFYNNRGLVCNIPLANPVLVYFSTAQLHLRQIKEARVRLLDTFNSPRAVDESTLTKFYDYFGLTSTFVTLLMTSLEAFVNQEIPSNYIYRETTKNHVKEYNYDQIQRWIDLDSKIKNILNVSTGKNFYSLHQKQRQYIDKLKSLRDAIVHTKSDSGAATYEEMYRTSLNFDFEESIISVRKFINFYRPCLIEDCPCNADF